MQSAVCRRQNALSKGALSDAIKSGEIEDPEVDMWSNFKTQMNPAAYVVHSRKLVKC